MKGILISIDEANNRGVVDTRNKKYGKLTIYFKEIPNKLKENSTISFEVVISRSGNPYAKFIEVIHRNQTIFNTEDRDKWYIWGEKREIEFIKKMFRILIEILG